MTIQTATPHRVVAILCALVLSISGCDDDDPTGPQDVARLQPSAQFPALQLPSNYRIEKVVEGLTYPTALTFDDQGRMYVAEAGGAFLELPPSPRILRVENGRTVEVVNLAGRGVRASLVGLTWHNGAFYISHRDPATRMGAVSRVTPAGAVTRILSGVLDAQAEHQVNDIKVGPDGRMYLATGPATNSGVVGIDLAPFVMLSPMLRATPCQELVLTGVNYRTPDFRTDDPSDVTETGAFVPFGTATTPGQRIPGTNKCGGSVLVFDPNNAEATVRPFASGLRNTIGLAFREGELYAAVNGYDVRGSRPFRDEFDATYRIRQGAWYGWPDFSAAFEPATERRFDVPNSLQAPKFRNGQPLPLESLDFLIDHVASGLARPDRSLVAGLHPVNSSPSGLDVAPSSWGEFAGMLFVAEWGDLAPPTNPLRDGPVGSRIVAIDPRTQQVSAFVRNDQPGPASEQGATDQGLERPFYVKFGPDGALYVVDSGIARINPAKPGTPYEFPPQTGRIWKVTRSGS